MTRPQPNRAGSSGRDRNGKASPTPRNDDSATRADTDEKNRDDTAHGSKKDRRAGIVAIDAEPEKRHNRAGG